MPSVFGSRSHVGVEAATSVQPAGQSDLPSVFASRSHVGTEAAVSVQPAGQSALSSVLASRSHVGVAPPTVSAVPVHEAGVPSVDVPVHEPGISAAVPVHVLPVVAVQDSNTSALPGIIGTAAWYTHAPAPVHAASVPSSAAFAHCGSTDAAHASATGGDAL